MNNEVERKLRIEIYELNQKQQINTNKQLTDQPITSQLINQCINPKQIK